jgi:N,N'-diacetyllegionaminate synthase
MDFVSKKFAFADDDNCIVIGEIGVNHNGSRDMLFKLLDEGIKAGLDVIKLQRFKAEEEISIHAATADYQKKSNAGESQLEMAKQLELPDEWLIEAFEYCQKRGVGFLCTAFDHSSVDFLVDVLGCTTVKVPSPEISNKPLLEYMAQKFQSLLVSTGASTLRECGDALEWIRGEGERELALMHCLSEYPAPLDQANLLAMKTMKESFSLPVGYSDHTVGSTAAIVAVALGAKMLEKHYTLDKSLPGPDHRASADITELKDYTKNIRDASASLGDGIKKPATAELKNKPLIRKSIVCAKDHLVAGTVITREMLGYKRPLVDGSIEPFDYTKIIGKVLKTEKKYDEVIFWTDISENIE